MNLREVVEQAASFFEKYINDLNELDSQTFKSLMKEYKEILEGFLFEHGFKDSDFFKDLFEKLDTSDTSDSKVKDFQDEYYSSILERRNTIFEGYDANVALKVVDDSLDEEVNRNSVSRYMKEVLDVATDEKRSTIKDIEGFIEGVLETSNKVVAEYIGEMYERYSFSKRT